jgi:50S ribosomal protein L16 3-hydroxylase
LTLRINGLDIDWFLREIWQKKPLLIRDAFRDWKNPLTPDELAGLACEDGIESRLITYSQKTDDWKLEHGPFPEARFAKVPKSHWTLLVQAVDQWVPEVAALIEPFRFIPDWRIDDVMISYAATGGGVGPHFDQYDVFLIQGAGRRRWQVGTLCDRDSKLRDNKQLRLLAEFEAREEWILDPGDMLYLPPRFAHDGVALDDACMTYSVGFRAPGQAELISHFADHVLEGVSDDDRFEDVERTPARNPGEITATALAELRRLALEKLTDEAEFRRWFGTYTTTPKYADQDFSPARPITAKTLSSRLKKYGALQRNDASRFAFSRGNDVLLFVDGCSYDGLDPALVEYLCAHRCWPRADLAGWLQQDSAIALLCDLFNRGSIRFDEPDHDESDDD